MYLALEPFLRHRWPRGMIAWNRLLAGRFRDPLVGRDILIGTSTCMVIVAVFGSLELLAPGWMGYPLHSSMLSLDTDALLGGRRLVAALWSDMAGAIAAVLFWLFLFLVLRVVLRRQWLAIAAFTLLIALTRIAGIEESWAVLAAMIGWQIVICAAFFFLLTRFGLVAVCAATACHFMLLRAPTVDFSAWYFGGTVMIFLIMLAMALYGFWTSLAGRPLIQRDLLDE
jgi:serine/threonine-protein kinase